jgi:hypothetical protein
MSTSNGMGGASLRSPHGGGGGYGARDAPGGDDDYYGGGGSGGGHTATPAIVAGGEGGKSGSYTAGGGGAVGTMVSVTTGTHTITLKWNAGSNVVSAPAGKSILNTDRRYK